MVSQKPVYSILENGARELQFVSEFYMSESGADAIKLVYNGRIHTLPNDENETKVEWHTDLFTEHSKLTSFSSKKCKLFRGRALGYE